MPDFSHVGQTVRSRSAGLRFTRSRDGQMRATVKVAYRVALDTIAAGLVDGFLNHDEDIETASRSSATRSVRRLLERSGEGWWAQNEGGVSLATEQQAFPEAAES
jgi:hypothetical protein